MFTVHVTHLTQPR